MTDCEIFVDVIVDSIPISVDIAPVDNGIEVIEVAPIAGGPIVIEAGEVTGLPGVPGPPGPPGASGVSPTILTAHNATETPLTLIEAPGQAVSDLIIETNGGRLIMSAGQGFGGAFWNSGLGPLFLESSGNLYLNGINHAAVITGSDLIAGGSVNTNLVVGGVGPSWTGVALAQAGGAYLSIFNDDQASLGVRTSIGKPGSWGNGGGPMLFLGNDTSDPTTAPVGGSILFTNGSIVGIKTPGAARLWMRRGATGDAEFRLGGDAFNGDSLLTLCRGGSSTEQLRLVAAAGGSTGLNNTYVLDRISDQAATTRNLMFRVSIDNGVTFTNQLQLGAYNQGVTAIIYAPINGDALQVQNSGGTAALLGISNTGSIYSIQSAAGNGVLSSGISGDANSRFFIDAAGDHFWGPGPTGLDCLLYRSGANELSIYNGNTTLAAFNPTYGIFATKASITQLAIGITPSFGSGAGYMLFMGDDTSDPTTNPVGGTIVYSSAGKLKARTPDGTVTQIAPAAGGMTPPVVITNTNYLTVPFTIKGAPSQNVDFLDYKDSSDTVRLGINIDGAQIANLTAAGVRILGTDVNQATLDIRNPASAANDVMQIHPSTGGYHRFWYNGRIDFGAGGMPQSNGLPSYNFLAGASLGALRIQTNMGVANWIGFDNLETAIPTISHIGGGLTMGNQGWPSSDSDATNGPYAKCFAYGIGGTPPRNELFAAHRSGQFAIGTGTWMNPTPTNWGNGSGPMLYIEDATADANSAAYVYPRATLLYGMGGNQFKIRMWDGSSLVFGPSGALSIGVSGGGVPTVGGSYGGGAGPMLFMANDQSDPTTNPVGGGILYVSNGALKYRGTSGTVTTLAPA